MLLHCNNYAITLQKHSFYNVISKCFISRGLHIAMQIRLFLCRNEGKGVLTSVNFAILKP